MKMSKGQKAAGCWVVAVAVAALVSAGGAAFAELGQPAPGNTSCRDSPPGDGRHHLVHNWLLIVITLITLFVFGRCSPSSW